MSNDNDSLLKTTLINAFSSKLTTEKVVKAFERASKVYGAVSTDQGVVIILLDIALNTGESVITGKQTLELANQVEQFPKELQILPPIMELREMAHSWLCERINQRGLVPVACWDSSQSPEPGYSWPVTMTYKFVPPLEKPL